VPGALEGVVIGTSTGPIVHPESGVLVDPITGQPVGPSPAELAEAVMVEAQEVGVDVRTATVEELVDRLVTPQE
jgi:hypothetical protein